MVALAHALATPRGCDSPTPADASSAGGEADLAFTYDALGRRVSKDDDTTVAVFTYSGHKIVAEYLANDDPTTTAPQRVYVFGTYVDETLAKIDTPNGVLYYHANRQYSTTVVSDSTGTVVERYAYTAYGVTTILAPDGSTVRATSSVGNPYMYTGRRLDAEFAATSEDVLYYYRARYYDPNQGRFLGRDPLEYVDGMSMYEYVGGMALTNSDPSGKWSFVVDKNLCTITMKVLIQTKFLDTPTFNWNNPRKVSYRARVKAAIEGSFNNTKYRIFPGTGTYTTRTQEIDMSIPYCPRIGPVKSITSTCPCASKGFAPKVDISFTPIGATSISEDIEIEVDANPIPQAPKNAPRIRSHHYPTNRITTGEEGTEQGWNGHNMQRSIVHEFGHAIGLEHPGAGLSESEMLVPLTALADEKEYLHRGKDSEGRAVDGRMDLMGVGMGMRDFYFDKWKDNLNSRYNGCNYVIR